MELGNPVGAALDDARRAARLTILDNDAAGPGPHPINDARYFVLQHYRDFLGREPDPNGFADWTGTLERCPNLGFPPSDASCDRVHVSSGFYRSAEFLATGYFAYRFYDAVLARLPTYAEFIADMARVGPNGSKELYADDFKRRPEFLRIYGEQGAASADSFVARLEQTAGVRLAGRAQLIEAMRTGQRSAAETLRAFVESPEVEARFFFRGFVTMQYFGYLRRDPDPRGWADWVDVLTNGGGGHPPGDFRHMIHGFIYSHEYARRFGRL